MLTPIEAAFLSAERSTSIEVVMRKPRKVQTPEERHDRLIREAQMKKDAAAADETAVDRMIKSNIEQFGP